MTNPDEGHAHPIRVVAQRTGLTTATLRAWERRYGVVAPTRSEGGQRLYSDADVHRLRVLARAVDGGRSISQVAPLGTGEVERLINEDILAAALVERPTREPARAELVRYAYGLVEAMKPEELERFLMRAAVSLRPAEVVSEILVPLLAEVGNAWSAGRMGASSEHVASVAIRRYLEWLTDTVQIDSGAPLALTGTPAGQRHEFGALLAGVIAADAGWGVRFLGPDLPASEIQRGAKTLDASLILLSAVHPELSADTARDIARMKQDLPERVDVVIGGSGAARFRDIWTGGGVLYFESLDLFRSGLDKIYERRFGPVRSPLSPA